MLRFVADMRGDQGIGAAQGLEHGLNFLSGRGLSGDVIQAR